MFLMGIFSAAQETSRRVRCRDSIANSAMAGGAMGAILYASHGKPPIIGIVMCSALGAGAHWTYDRYNFDNKTRSMLVSLDLLDPSALPPRIEPEDEGPTLFERMLPYLPLRKLTDEEQERYERNKALKYKDILGEEEMNRSQAKIGKKPDGKENKET